MKCECCNHDPMTLISSEYSDVGTCSVCGLPYWYVRKSPVNSPKDVMMAQRFWLEHHSRVFPSDYPLRQITPEGLVSYMYNEAQVVIWNNWEGWL
jgi:hypothetical protein